MFGLASFSATILRSASLMVVLGIGLGLTHSEAVAFQKKPSLPDSWSKKVDWRSIGPANMSGRITSIAVYEGDSNIWWAASAAGGLLKTTNNGTTFEHQFDDQATVSIGDVQVSKTNPDILWVGTGEANPRNSVSWGDGVYKSTNGGKTWKNMGLNKTFQIGRIAIHPENHDIVYVGALGRLWGPNEERGLYKTTDGGKKWEKVLFVDDKTGVIDVQMNPENPDELFVATYQRMRDGFDGNDPAGKYGAGSGIYKTTDAGKSFTRLTQGLPSCNLGRVGLSIYHKDPTHLVAIVESEKIAKEPDTTAYAGLQGENADVGAKVTSVVKDGPAKKGGLKIGDIVVSVDGQVIHSYNDLLSEMRKHKAGDTVKFLVSRERKPVDLTIELAKKPTPRSTQADRNGAQARDERTRRNPFTGTLGGQAANLQGQQGDDEHEYGGVYLSKDSGDSWERINTLNPRPMYYSQIRIDPTDINNMYVLGTSLYRSKDKGKTFTGDGGSDGIHVDHHALWINPKDSRHMILGNDGGIYVTHNRMENWDHHNHIAIGQFYHVAVGPDRDYRIFGGLQDNGSWGGPSRVGNDSGIVNTDWFRIGGGDGFVCQVDPDDADQIYFESQNGGMGRNNLRTGERGFIRPRAPRGTRYRFNWKTPFMLSPHNSKIHYSAGNHVFRSYNKGTGAKAISPDITNTDKGAGSAITESPAEAGVLYAGTTDGALWMTKDSGKTWTALYSTKKEGGDKKSDPKEKGATEAKDSKDSEKEKASGESSEKGKGSKEAAGGKDPLTGVWVGQMVPGRFSGGQAPPVTFELKLSDDGKVTGEIRARRKPQEISDASFDKGAGELKFVVEGRRGSREYSATVKGGKMSGTMTSGRFNVEFEALRQKATGSSKSNPATLLVGSGAAMGPTAILYSALIANKQYEDGISGNWNGVLEYDQALGGSLEIEIELEVDKQNGVTGIVSTSRGEMEIVEGNFKPSAKKIYFVAENDSVSLDLEATVDGSSMSGDISIYDGMIEADFSATKAEKAKEQTAKKQEQYEQAQEPPQRGLIGVRLNARRGASAQIAVVIEGSGAEEAGLKPGDTIKAIDGDEVADGNALVQELRKRTAGDKVKIRAERDGATKEFEVTLTAPLKDQQRPQGRAGGNRGNRPGIGQAETKSDEQKEGGEPEASAKSAEDKVSGTWTGTITSPLGEHDLTVMLSRKSDSEITGTYETSFGEQKVSEGEFGKEKKTLMLVAENPNFTLEFNGKVDAGKYSGQVDFNGGQFEMEFELTRTEKPSTAGASNDKKKNVKKSTGKTLADLMPGPRWVSSLHASKFKASRCYVTFDGHRSNDDMPHLCVSEDYGQTWKSIRGNLPDNAGSARVLREDLVNENLLYLGCEFGAWVSIDRGKTWTKFKNLPTVAVHEIAMHPTAGEIVAATHGRSLWIADVSTLRQFSKEKVASRSELFQPGAVIKWRSGARRGSSGTRKFVGENPGTNANIFYSLGRNARSIELEIVNINGDTVKRFDKLGTSKGLHQVEWDLRSSGGRGRRGRTRVSAGQYLVNLRVDGVNHTKRIVVENDPNSPADAVAEDEELQWWLEHGIED